MHDPSFLAVEIHAPIPVPARWRNSTGVREPFIRRRTNPENLGERVYPWWKLRGYCPRIGRWHFTWPTLVEAWHDEPGGADMGTHCNYRARHDHPVRWCWQHRSHLRWKLIPYLRVRRWLMDRCAECGKRFRWKEARVGAGWDSPDVLHDKCHGYRHMRRKVADLAKYVRGEADATERWRVGYDWLDTGAEQGKSVQFFADLGVGKPLDPAARAGLAARPGNDYSDVTDCSICAMVATDRDDALAEATALRQRDRLWAEAVTSRAAWMTRACNLLGDLRSLVEDEFPEHLPMLEQLLADEFDDGDDDGD